jgi:hypothetical protein
VKVDPNGGIAYSTYVGGPAGGEARAVAVDAAGDAFVTGHTLNAGFITTSGAVAGDPSLNTGYIIKLDPSGGTATLAIHGFGGYAIALDPQGNVYAAAHSMARWRR